MREEVSSYLLHCPCSACTQHHLGSKLAALRRESGGRLWREWEQKEHKESLQETGADLGRKE